MRGHVISGKTSKRNVKSAVRVQYGALPYRFTLDTAFEILLVTTRQSQRWIVPKGWPIKGLKPRNQRPVKLSKRRACEVVSGQGDWGCFTYDKILDGSGIRATCKVRVFPLLVKAQSRTWPEIEQRMAK